MAGKSTGQERVHAQLRADILGGRFHPGQRLRFASLCEDYGASVGVIREAMSRLAEQGLVTGAAQLGFKVASISREDLIQLTQARVCVEVYALRMAIAEGDLAWESELLASHHSLERTPMLAAGEPPHLNDAWCAAHADFHANLLSGCGNARLCSIAANLRDSAEIYRRWSVSEVRGPARDIAAEHRAILEATLERDADRAAVLLQEHFDLTTRLLLESDLVENPGESPLPTGT
ncbi:regulatory protein GntR [Mycolicibacterium canariasense]|uniref:Regulatory protein GntR n=1 Tax=Mycolicibacterium canariasense TaxID=228230 RepID=A0A100WI49_MYCCR|nr:FCD domain-containing protein [Mycolicibacterium canariasense]MCV7211805.1 FCD domain-containing protein [Mycolicibacterium canariasense]ORV08130.1 hypothetical protein AWB94_12555 [Mycolicibacterium canariasense]GAS98334.1 regulatory protein GntR [Mycolicibacterium canariasense]